jgi:hypothetical protein
VLLLRSLFVGFLGSVVYISLEATGRLPGTSNVPPIVLDGWVMRLDIFEIPFPYELRFDLSRDVGLDYAPRQLFRCKIKPPT